MTTVLNWLYRSPLAQWLKYFAAGLIGWLMLNLDNVGLHPALAFALAGSLPVLVNWLNPNDPRNTTDNVTE